MENNSAIYQAITESEDYNLRYLFTILVIGVLTLDMLIVLFAYLTRQIDEVALTLVAISAIFITIIYIYTRLEKFRIVTWLIIFGIGTIILVDALLRDGVFNPALSGLLFIIMMTGLLHGIRAAVNSAILSSIIILAIGVAQYYSLTPLYHRAENSLITVSLMYLTFVFLTVVLLWLILGRTAQLLESERQKAIALNESETRIRALVEGYFEGIVITVDGIIVDLNQATASILGYESKEELLGISTLTLMTEESGLAVAHAIQNQIETTYEIMAKRKDGSLFPAELLGRNAIFSGQPARIVAFRDLTERYQTEEQLRQAQKLESLGVMAGGIAHDFNNLLLAIMGQSSVAKAKLEPDSAAHKHLEKSLDAAKRAANLTKQLLAYSGQGHFLFSSIDLNKLILENVELLELVASHSVRLEKNLLQDLPAIKADEVQIQQVLFNLLINAKEAGDGATSRIHIITAVRTLTSPSQHYGRLINQLVAPGKYVLLSVQDDGLGIPPDVFRQIFEPFYSTKGTGRGLGLAAILGIVRGHHGGLAVETKVGQGTTFTLLFPVAPQKKEIT